MARDARTAGRFLSVVLVAAGLAACDPTGPAPRSDDGATAAAPQPDVSVASASRSPSPAASPPTVRVAALTGASPNETGPGTYRYQVEYPRLEGLGGRELGIDTTIQGTMQRDVYDFVDAARAGPAGPSPSELSCRSRTVRVTGRLAVLRVDCTRYQAGAAHPDTATHTFNCDLGGGRLLALQDLFGIGSAYLTVLSDAARDQLTKLHVGDERTLADGTAPAAANFRDFLLTQGGLVIVFARYQVAPGAAGQPEVSVPYSALDRYLAPGVRDLVAG